MLAATVLAFILVAAAATAARQPHDRVLIKPDVKSSGEPTERLLGRHLSSGSVSTYRGLTARQWAAQFRRRTRQLQNAQAVLRHRPSVTEAIELACTTYRVSCSEMRAIISCESGFNPRAFNPSSSSGLMQILFPSTWRTTPYARFDVFSPYANALAGAYMLSQGRRREWVC